MRQVVAWLFGIGLLCNALLFVPQVIAVWKSKSAKDISLVTFGGFNVLQIIGATHGYFQHDPSLMWGTLASLVTSGTVTVLAIFYRTRASSTYVATI
jgi:MtN3 and saliva related transmembrane protein